jgi:hypothetical protein
MTPSPSHPRRKGFATAGQALLAAGAFAGGILAAGVLTKSAPAAPEDCPPIIGCITTTIPSVPLPTVTLPTLPTTTNTTTGSSGGVTTTGTTTSQGVPPVQREPEAAFTASSSIRVRGKGANRAVEIRLRLTKPARVSALLTRNGRALAQRQFAAHAGSSAMVLRVARTTKAGAARLALTFRTASGETARAGYRLRLPR